MDIHQPTKLGDLTSFIGISEMKAVFNSEAGRLDCSRRLKTERHCAGNLMNLNMA